MRFTTDVEQFSEGSGLRKMLWPFLWNAGKLQERSFCVLWFVGLTGMWL